nr:PREDICTED: integrin alpha-PS2 isoform X1 [Megachile rotundata]
MERRANMWIMNFILGFIGLIFLVEYQEAFNVETKNYAVYRSEDRSMFGFAVSVYRDRVGRGWAIVGAPEAETSQAGVYRGGAVYKCDIAADDRCQIINFDSKGNNHVRNPSVPSGLSQIDNKTLQWFGATVSASQTDGGPIMSCAPRYIWFSVSQPKHDTEDNRWSKESTVGNRREPVGTCWVVTNNFEESVEYSPCRTRYWGYHRQGSCQAGLGASMSKNGERLFIGAPGSWYWQGQIYSISTAMRLKFVATMLFTPEAEISGQAFSQPLHNRKLMFTKEGPATEDDSYMGYSVTTGDFAGKGDSGTAVGVPRGNELLGKVILFTSNMTNPRNITGVQMGAYFGYAVASGDIDGDGLDDLIVGAPMYTIPDNPEMTIETGRVYVYYQGNESPKFLKVDTRDGESNRGRFGLSLASLGDIDRDGYGDFVVGAPYGGLRGRGAVYIYHGSRTGVLEKYSQVIYAENLDMPVSTFGFSVSGGLDLDGNRYPDLVVGAYESASAMFFRSRPVIKMDSFVSFGLQSKLISLDDRNCTLSSGTRVTCLLLRACFKYNGEGVFPRHRFNIQYVLDVKKMKTPRMFFLELEDTNVMNRTIEVEQDREFCSMTQVYVTPNIRDKLTSLDAEMRMSLAEERLEDNRPRDPRFPLRPILGSTTSRKDSLSIRKNCGSDNVCIPDLQMYVSSNVHKYLLGSGKKLELDVLVQNIGEDAFESTYNLRLPYGIDYINVEKIETMGIPVQCSAPNKQWNNNTLRCDIGNPLPKQGIVKFKVLLQPVTSHGMKPIYEFEMDVNTTNPENNSTTGDNKYLMKLPIWIETDLQVDGESKPKDLYYNPDNYTSETNATTEAEFGPAVTHNYTIRNQGPSEVIEAEAFLIWPAQTLAGNELLYLLEQPETSGSIQCESANANYLSLKMIERKRTYYQPYLAGVSMQSQSGQGINVQSGFEQEKSKLSQHEETEINTGDSSDIQKIRHSSTSNVVTNGSRVTQSTGGQSVHLTYTQNSSRTGSMNTGSQTSGTSGAILYSQSGSTGEAVGGVFRGNEDNVLRPSEDYGQSQTTYENRYGGHIGSSSGGEWRQQEHRQEDRTQYERRKEQLGRPEERPNYANRQEDGYRQENRFRVTSESYGAVGGGFVSGDREDSIRGGEFGFQLRNVSSKQDLEQLFGSLSRTAVYELQSGRRKNYVRFMARFRNSGDRKEYIELQDGSIFPLQDQYGNDSYMSSDPKDGRFFMMEGELLIDSTGKKRYIVLKDGRRFLVEGSFSYSEERTITVEDPRYQSGSNQYDSKSYSSSWNEEAERARVAEYEKQYEEVYRRTHEERRTEDRTMTSRIYGRENRGADGTVTDVPNSEPRSKRESDMVELKDFKKFESLQRSPRDLAKDPAMLGTLGGQTDYENNMKPQEPTGPCDAAKCVMLKCVLGPLKKDEEVWLVARYRVDARTLKKAAPQEKVRVSTKLVAQVTKQQYIGTPAEQVVKSHEIKTNVAPSSTPSAPDVIPLWVVVLSACAGTIILLLLIFLLHKCGFFKRNRPSDAPERQPLNRNGHFQQGDDH